MSKKTDAPPWLSQISVPEQEAVILGIDPSLTQTGICLLRGNEFVESFVLNPGEKVRGVERLLWIHARIRDLIAEAEPHYAAVEGYAHGAKFNREALGELGGVIRLALGASRIPTLVVAPQTLRKFILPEVASGKEFTLLASFKRWGREFATNDECDAHGLAQLARLRLCLDSGVAGCTASKRMIEAATTAEPIIRYDGRPRRRV